MNKLHREILKGIKETSLLELKDIDKNTKVWGVNYSGTKRLNYKLSQPGVRHIAKKWIKKHKDISLEGFINLLNSLYQGQSHDERLFGGILLEYQPKLRKQIDPFLINSWLNNAEGWSEVDSLCQMCFGQKEMLTNWLVWKKLLEQLVKDKNIHKKRASLVLLTKPVRESDDNMLSNLAFNNIDKLKKEQDILVTKAISWLLRDLIKNHRKEVEEYLDKNVNILPKIALRETRNKLRTGRK